MPLQPEGNYLSCLNTAAQYKPPSQNFQMNKVEEVVDKPTNCASVESTSAITPEVEDSSWSSRSRDWSEEVECISADTENELNSSPQHQVIADSARLSDMKRKHMLRSPQNTICSDGMKYSGIGRGKHRMKPHLPGTEFDRRPQDNSVLCNSAESNSDLTPSNSVEIVAENSSPSCSSSHSEEMSCDDVSKDSMKKNSSVFPSAVDSTMLQTQVQTHLNGAYSLSGDARNRTGPTSNTDHFRDYDYKKMQNGVDSFQRGYRNKPFRMNRLPNNNSSNSLQYKGFENRTYPHRFPPTPPLQSNVKGYRPVKAHESHYRHHDNRRHQSASRPPFPPPLTVEKVVYAKHKSNIYATERDFVYEVNRNFSSQNYNIQNDISRHISGSGSFVPQTNVTAFRPKHNASRIGNCDKILCNKNETSSNNTKSWHSGNVFTDSNTSTVTCHNRTVVTPVKSMVTHGHCGICTSHSHAKHCPSLKEESIRNEKVDFPDSCDSFNPEHSRAYSDPDKVEQNAKLNCSSDYSIHDSRIPPNDNYSILTNRERLSTNDLANCNCEYVPTNDAEIKNHLLEKDRSPDKTDSCVREKLGFPSTHLRKDLHSEKTDASPKVSSGNMPLSKQSSTEFCDSDSSHNIMFLGDSQYVSSPGSGIPHSSYAEVIRMPVNTVSKVSSCQMSNCVEVTVPKNEYLDIGHEKMQPRTDGEHPNTSEWIMTRLSQIDISAGNLANVNGMVSHQVPPNAQQAVNPRPIAVSLEKPSFYNSKMAVGINVQQSNLSSPERKVLECQYVEEHLSNVLGYKKSGDKLTFLTDLSANLLAPAEQSNACVSMNVRTDSTFSDSSSVCSSMSGTFKADGHCQMTKPSTPPVIIMNSCGPSENIQELSFGIEMDEIMKLCGDSDLDSAGDSPITLLPDSDFSSSKIHDVCEAERLDDANVDSFSRNEEESIAAKFITVGNKKLLWKDDVDVSKCNMPQIVGFLQESVGESAGASVKFYSEE